MTDIKERLRTDGDDIGDVPYGNIMIDAADEIERLEKVVDSQNDRYAVAAGKVRRMEGVVLAARAIFLAIEGPRPTAFDILERRLEELDASK